MEQIKHIDFKTVVIDRKTGEIVDRLPEFNTEPGRYIECQDFSDCPSQADQSQIHENNINVMMEKYAPDQLAQLLAARGISRVPIEGHDFSQEPELMEAMNVSLRIQKEFDSLPEIIKLSMKGSPVNFIKFCENPQNRPQLEAWGLAKKADAVVAAAAPAPALAALDPATPALPAKN